MPHDDTNWISDDTAQVATELGTEQRRQAGEKPTPSEVDETTALLIRARGFIERGWCRHSRALSAKDDWVCPTDDQADAWSANGALVAAGVPWNPAYRDHPAVQRLHAAIRDCSDQSSTISILAISIFNDRQETVEPVLAAFDAAIAMGDLTAFDRAIAGASPLNERSSVGDLAVLDHAVVGGGENQRS